MHCVHTAVYHHLHPYHAIDAAATAATAATAAAVAVAVAVAAVVVVVVAIVTVVVGYARARDGRFGHLCRCSAWTARSATVPVVCCENEK
jgi:hypothetical protein